MPQHAMQNEIFCLFSLFFHFSTTMPQSVLRHAAQGLSLCKLGIPQPSLAFLTFLRVLLLSKKVQQSVVAADSSATALRLNRTKNGRQTSLREPVHCVASALIRFGFCIKIYPGQTEPFYKCACSNMARSGFMGQVRFDLRCCKLLQSALEFPLPV